MKKKIALSLVLVMLFSLFPQLMIFSATPEVALAAGANLASLKDVSGGVYVKKGGGSKEFKGINGMALAQGDTVRTDKGGSATVNFTTGSKMSVGPNTVFTVTKTKETKDSGGKISIKLKSGSVWNKVKRLVNVEDEYEIQTPTTVMGVRGTLFLASVDPATGETTGSVMEGAVGVHQNTPSNIGQSERLVPMGNSVQVPSYQDYSTQSSPPPEPVPMDMNDIIRSEDPSILASIAVDMVERIQELQQQSQSYLAGYEDSNNQAYLQGALQLAQINTLMAEMTEQFMNAVEGTEQEQQMNEILEEHNTNVEAIRQQVELLTNEVEQTRNDAVNAAQQAGISPEQIGRLMQNAPTASASAGASTGTGSSPLIPPPPVTPPAPPTTGGGDEDDGESSGPGNDGEPGNGGDPDQGDQGPKAASPGVILYKADSNISPNQFETGDVLVFQFDRPVKVEDHQSGFDLTNFELWESSLKEVESEASFGSNSNFDYNNTNGFVQKFFIELGNDFEFPINGLTFSIPKESLVDVDGKSPINNVRFTLPILVGGENEYSLYNDGALVTNLTDAGIFHEMDQGSYGRYKEIPQDFILKGILNEDLLNASISNSNVRLGIWYYDQYYHRWSITPDGPSDSETISELIDVDIVSFIMGIETGTGVYTWQAKLPETMRNVINQAPSRDYFIELSIKEKNPEPQNQNEVSKIVAGAITIEKTPLRIIDQSFYQDANNPGSYQLTLFFNKPLSEYQETSLKDNIVIKINSQSNMLEVENLEHDYRTLSITIKDKENEQNGLGLLENLDIHSSLEISSFIPVKDLWGNELELNHKIYKRPYYNNDFGEWLEFDNPIITYYDFYYLTGVVELNTNEPLPENTDFKDYFRVIDFEGNTIENAVKGAEYSESNGLVVHLDTELLYDNEQNFYPRMLELVNEEGTSNALLKCNEDRSYKTLDKVKIGNSERLIVGVLGYSIQRPSNYFRLELDVDYDNVQNSNLTYYSYDEKLNANYGDIKEHFIIKNIIGENGDGFYRPTIAKIISAMYVESSEELSERIIFEIEPGNLKIYGVIIPLQSLTNIYGFGYDDYVPFLPLRYDGIGSWIIEPGV